MSNIFSGKKIETLSHLFIWIGYSLLVFSGPILSQDFSTFTLQITIRALFLNSMLFYINTFVLLPQMIGRNKYTLYILTIVILLAGSAMLYDITDQWFRPNKEMVFDMNKMDRGFFDHKPPMDSPMPLQNKMAQLGRGPSLLFGFMSSLGILFISTIFWMITETKRRQQRELSLINENLTTEMKFLKSQINPHFLFNALNNVYSLSHLNSKKTPEMILKLSDMLRFMLYDSEDKKVPIGKEIDYIKHFIDFQKLKIEGEPRIAIDIEQSDLTVMIEPMLLIPFIENAFKHSKIEDVRNSWLSIDLKTTSSTIHFKVRNSLPASSIKVDNIGGIGLENVRKRLQFLYPKRHRLEILCSDNSFNVDLTIDIRKGNTDN
jgi:two-component system, LytTR family, sensor kinase